MLIFGGRECLGRSQIHALDELILIGEGCLSEAVHLLLMLLLRQAVGVLRLKHHVVRLLLRVLQV
jgi:hypothetical protein